MESPNGFWPKCVPSLSQFDLPAGIDEKGEYQIITKAVIDAVWLYMQHGEELFNE